MNDTNRALNRIVLFLIGIVFLALGALVIAIMTWPTAGEVWTDAGAAAENWLDQAVRASAIAGTTLSWIALGATAAVILVIVLLILSLTSVAGRRSRTVLRSTGSQNPLGRVTVTEAFVSDALGGSLSGERDVLSANVTANTIRDEPVLHVSVIPRQNTNPREIVTEVDRLVTSLAALTGEDTATYISVHSSIRARFAQDQRRLS